MPNVGPIIKFIASSTGKILRRGAQKKTKPLAQRVISKLPKANIGAIADDIGKLPNLKMSTVREAFKDLSNGKELIEHYKDYTEGKIRVLSKEFLNKLNLIDKATKK